MAQRRFKHLGEWSKGASSRYEQEIQQRGVDTQQPDESSNKTKETKQPNRLSPESLRGQRSMPQIKMVSNRLNQAEESQIKDKAEELLLEGDNKDKIQP